MAASETDLITNAACYRQACINPVQQRALLIYALALELAADGGTDYTAQLTGTLLTDAAALPVEKNEDAYMAARINLAFIKAGVEGASVPASVGAKIAAIACLTCVDSELLDLATLLLLSKIADEN